MGSKSQNGLEIISYLYMCLAIYNESNLNSQSLGSQFLVSRNFDKGMGQTVMKNGNIAFCHFLHIVKELMVYWAFE